MASKAAKKVRDDPGKVEERVQPPGRDEELCNKKDVRDALLEVFKDVAKGFDDQAERSDDNMDWWDVYNCVLGDRQFYNGNAKIFVPIVKSAVDARKTRFVNQMFPASGRYVEVTTEDGSQPHEETALLEHYVRHAKLRTRVAPALVKNGDIEGLYAVQVTWETCKRHVVWRTQKQPDEGANDLVDTEDVEDISEETIETGGPVVRVVADSDILVLPPTADSLERAIADGGSVTTIVRWSKAKLKRMVAEGEIDPDVADDLIEEMRVDKVEQRPDKGKEMVDAAGVHTNQRGKYVLLYRTWLNLTIDGERRLCLVYFAGKDRIASCKRNPYWSDRIDVIAAPPDKVDGCFKGMSKIGTGVCDLQYQANDAVNQAMDSASYALMPIVMTDPEKNPKLSSMILTLSAVWETSPQDTQFVNFPPLWKDGLQIVADAKQEIFQALSVNPAQITGATDKKSKRPTQAEIANEQQIDMLTTADAVTVIEDEILTPMLRFILELDHQFRDRPLRVREYGETGMKSNMALIPPIQMDKLYSFRWYGVEAARNVQQMQQQVAMLNVLRGIPPQLYKGYTIDLGPLLSHMVGSIVGPRFGPLTFRSAREDLGFDPNVENELMMQGHVVPVHALDNHQQHIQSHTQAGQQTGDPTGHFRVHVMAHMNAIQTQQMEQAQQQQPQVLPGGRGPGGGQPRIGAAPGQPRGAQNPPGAIHQDRMKDPTVPPR